jgi:anti-anti-sigma factor
MFASLPPHRLEIDVDADGSSLGIVVRLKGELDAASVGALERSLMGLPMPCPKLVLDLHRLSFVDSLGLNMLFRAKEWAESRHMALRVTRAPVHVQRLIALAALDGTIGPFYTDVATALRA